jgi:hypothetical protein
MEDIMNNDNIIIWQKWIDPFGRDDQSELEEFANYNDDNDSDLIEVEETQDSDETENTDKIKQFLVDRTIKYGIKVIATPMGVIPVNDNTASGKIFNFWIGHTNFDITKKIAETIEKTDGVESLDVYTRYRFRISVGKAFEDSMVMRHINKNVYKELADAHNP